MFRDPDEGICSLLGHEDGVGEISECFDTSREWTPESKSYMSIFDHGEEAFFVPYHAQYFQSLKLKPPH